MDCDKVVELVGNAHPTAVHTSRKRKPLEASTMVAMTLDNPGAEYQAARSAAVVWDRSRHGLLRVEGRDARLFLHNLCTNDIKKLADGSSCEAFFTTAKARVVAHVFVLAHGGTSGTEFLLDMVPGLADKLQAHLQRHIISEDVTVSDLTGQWASLRVAGPDAARIVAKIKPATVWRFGGLGLPAFDIYCSEPAALVSLQERLVTEGAVPAGEQTHEVLRVEAGLPEFGKDIDENRLVMEVGRTAQAISYTKGCFLGQEPIVMARDRGQVNRTLLGVKTTAGQPLPSGARLFQGETEAGQVTSSVRSPRLDQVIALAYLKRGFQESGLELTVEPATDGRKALVATLPFIPVDSAP